MINKVSEGQYWNLYLFLGKEKALVPDINMENQVRERGFVQLSHLAFLHFHDLVNWKDYPDNLRLK